MSTTPTGPTTSADAPSIPAPSQAVDQQRPSGPVADGQQANLPTQLTLPGQAAAPEGPLDLSGMFLMHHAFRRDLVAFAAAAANTPTKDSRTWKALSKRWQRFASVLHKHHTAEDAGLWPKLLDRARSANDAAAVETLEAMALEHHALDPLLGFCSVAFARIPATKEDSIRFGLTEDLAELSRLLHAHLEHEERDALALVQRHLALEEWKAFEADVAKHYKPWDIPFALCWVLHGLPEEGREAVFALADAPPRKVWNLLRPGFERRERRAFRYV